MTRRVLLLSAEYPPARGGVGDYTRELAGALTAGGVNCRVLTTRRPGSAAENPPGVPVDAAISGWGWRSWGEVATRLRADPPDVVHVQYQTAAYGMHPAVNLLPAWLRARGIDVPVVTTFHDLRIPYLFPKAGAVRHLAAMALARGSKRFILVTPEHWSETPLRWLARVEPGLAARAWVIPIGSNIPTVPPPSYDRTAWRAGLGFPPDCTVVAYFGFVNSTKGVDDLLRALARLRAEGEPVRLLMVGGEGASNAADAALHARLDALASTLGLEDAITRTGYAGAETVSGHLLAADLCVLPFRDGATLQRGTLLAALAHGLPVMSTTIPPPGRPTGDREGDVPRGWATWTKALCHEENIWLVPPQAPERLAEAIRTLSQDALRRATLARGALALARRLSWDEIARKHLDVYAELATTPHPRD